MMQDDDLDPLSLMQLFGYLIGFGLAAWAFFVLVAWLLPSVFAP